MAVLNTDPTLNEYPLGVAYSKWFEIKYAEKPYSKCTSIENIYWEFSIVPVWPTSPSNSTGKYKIRHI